LGAHQIRAEFGKAIDFKVASYLIWSFKTPDPRIVEGARRLGLDLKALEFDGPCRTDLIAQPEILAAHIGNTMEAVRRDGRFAKALASIGEDVKREMLNN